MCLQLQEVPSSIDSGSFLCLATLSLELSQTIQIKTKKSVIPYLYVDSRKYSPLHRGCAIRSSYNVDELFTLLNTLIETHSPLTNEVCLLFQVFPLLSTFIYHPVTSFYDLPSWFLLQPPISSLCSTLPF